MEYQIIEKIRFTNKFVKLLKYLENEWGYGVAQHFFQETLQHINLLKRQPFVGKSTNHNKARSLLITKHNRLVYKISNNKVIILDLVDTRMNPSRNKY